MEFAGRKGPIKSVTLRIWNWSGEHSQGQGGVHEVSAVLQRCFEVIGEEVVGSWVHPESQSLTTLWWTVEPT